MSDNTATSISLIIDNLTNKNLCGGGIADGQKVLIAAVQTGCVSTGVANEMSLKYDLGLHWDNFAQTVEKFLLQSPSHISELAEHFEVAEVTVKRWYTGGAVPHTRMCNLIMDYIANHQPKS